MNSIQQNETGYFCREEARKSQSRRSALAGLCTSQVAMVAAMNDAHPPYSTDLAPSDFYMFSKLKTYLRCRNFESNESVIDAVNDQDEDFNFEGIGNFEPR